MNDRAKKAIASIDDSAHAHDGLPWSLPGRKIHEQGAVDYVFSAIADPTRRTILALLQQGPRTIATIARDFPISRPAVAKHLLILRRAGLVRTEAKGREKWHHAETDGLGQVLYWVQALISAKNPARDVDTIHGHRAGLVVNRAVVLPLSRSDAWDYVVNNRVFGGWRRSDDFQPQVGHHFTMMPLHNAGFARPVQAQLTAVTPGLRYCADVYLAHGPSEPPTQVVMHFETLAATATQIAIVHAGFEALERPAAARALADRIWMSLLQDASALAA